jgi:hypothetical protein
VLATQGELDEALRIWREELLPVFERLGNVPPRARTLGQIADVLADRGDLDVALATWRESLAVFQRLAAPDLIQIAQQRIEELKARKR